MIPRLPANVEGHVVLSGSEHCRHRWTYARVPVGVDLDSTMTMGGLGELPSMLVPERTCTKCRRVELL